MSVWLAGRLTRRQPGRLTDLSSTCRRLQFSVRGEKKMQFLWSEVTGGERHGLLLLRYGRVKSWEACIRVIYRSTGYLAERKQRKKKDESKTAKRGASRGLFSVSPQGKSVVLLPVVSSTVGGLVVQVTLVDTSGLLTSGGQASSLSVLVDRVGDPVVGWVVSDGVVGWVHEDDLEVLVGGVFVDPVRVEDSQVGCSSADSFLGGDLQGLLVLEVVDTLVGWLTVGGTLWNRSLSVTSSDSDSVDDKALLSLVAQLSGLLWSGWLGCSVDHLVLSVFPTSDSQQESHDIGLLLSLKFF